MTRIFFLYFQNELAFGTNPSKSSNFSEAYLSNVGMRALTDR